MVSMNTDVKRAAEQARVKLWQIADALGMADSSFSRKLRKELSPEMKERCFAIIKELSEGVSA
jgi:hypothetical protein